MAQNYLYNRYSKNFYIAINVNDYVEHRAEVLQSYAQKLASRALEEGQAQHTDPMSNSERQDHPPYRIENGWSNELFRRGRTKSLRCRRY